MTKLFLSYRHEETKHSARLIYDRLKSVFGDRNIFFDIRIPLGHDYREVINHSIDQSQILVVVIGENWLRILQKRSQENKPDWASYEIERAFEQGLTVLPVLVDGGKLPEEPDLPAALRRLPYCQGIEVRSGIHWDGGRGRISSRGIGGLRI